MAETVVVFHKQLGDTLLLEPALHRIAQDEGAAPVLLAPLAFTPLLELMPGSCRTALTLRGRHRRVIAFDPGSTTARKSFFIRADSKYLLRFTGNYQRWFHSLVYSHILEHPGGRSYRAHYYWQHAPVATPSTFRPPRLDQPPAAWSTKLPEHPFILFHPGSAWKNKCWDPSSWALLLQQLHAHTGVPFVLTGGTSDFESAHLDEITRLARTPMLNLAGQTSLREYLSLCANASMVIAVDGSASHLAAAFSRPVITLFGPTEPCHWHHPTPICIALRGTVESAGSPNSMDTLQPESVLSEAVRLWDSVAHI